MAGKSSLSFSCSTQIDPVTPQKWGLIVPRSPAPGHLPMAAGAIDIPGILMSMGRCEVLEER